MMNRKLNIKIHISLMVVILITLQSSFIAKAQIREVLIGEKMPDVEMKDILNYPLRTAQISQFKGKLLILDFWATYCAPCVAMFPKTDSLTRLFNDKVKFLGVTKESRKKASAFLTNMYNVKHIRPISVVSDSLLSSFFNYSEIPYYVWINGSGEVIATTGPEDITAKNIDAVLLGKPTTFNNRNDLRRRNVDWEKSLFVLSNNYTLSDSLAKREEIPREKIISYSIASGYVPHAGGQLWFDQSHFGVYNVTIEFLFRWYYTIGFYENPVKGAFNPAGNHVFEISDKKLLNKISIPPGSIKNGTKEMDDWTVANGVSYEIVFPKTATWREKMNMVKQDLFRFFEKPLGFRAHVEKRLDSNTTVLRRINPAVKFIASGRKAEEHHDLYSYSQTNMPLSQLIGTLNSYFFQNRKISFVDKSEIDVPVDLQLNCDMTKVNSINAALMKYGLKFTVEPTEIDVLVFSDKKL